MDFSVPAQMRAAHHACSQWPPDHLLDIEPEVCLCLIHGHDLPCRLCELGNVTPKLEARP